MASDIAAITRQSSFELEHLAAFLYKLDEAGWQAASACPGWSVRDVVNHLGVGSQAIGAMVSARLSGQAVALPDQSARQTLQDHMAGLTNQQATAEIEQANRSLIAGLIRAEPAQLSGMMPFFGREVPLIFLAGIRLSELMLHGWDIYTSADPEARLDPQSTAAVFPVVMQMMPRFIQQEKTAGLNELYHFHLGDAPSDNINIEFSAGQPRPSITNGPPPAGTTPDLQIKLDQEQFYRLIWGRLDIARELEAGRLHFRSPLGETAGREKLLYLSQVFKGV